MKIVRLHATWCQPCHALDRGPLKQFIALHPEVSIEAVDCSVDMPAKWSDYNVMALPTMLWLDARGGELARVVGLEPGTRALEVILAMHQKALAAPERRASLNPSLRYHSIVPSGHYAGVKVSRYVGPALHLGLAP